MADSVIPPRVGRLVVERLPTVVHVEALLLLRHHGEEALDMAVLAADLFIDARAARRVVEDLVAHGLVHAASPEGPVRYAPESAEIRAAVDELAEVHRTRLIPLSRFIHERAEARSIENFANAFRLRKD
ncbi:MAG TPA: hypothetical protein VHU80_17275 [Polyangiaceae bacterium]|nr:hypothetical protein [Polyangiaceae bacterium]